MTQCTCPLGGYTPKCPIHGPTPERARTMSLTAYQHRFIGRIRREGSVVQNGRARRTLLILRDLGLIDYRFELVPQLYGRHTERYTVTLTEAGKAAADA